jgi:hypothetical protein
VVAEFGIRASRGGDQRDWTLWTRATSHHAALAHVHASCVSQFACGWSNVNNRRAARPVAPGDETRRLAQIVRTACIRAALDGYERAGLSGMCDEGRWELAIDAIRSLDLEAIVNGSQRR